jgi:hypothetical protein
VVVEEGVATGFEMLAALKLPEGSHAKVVPPDEVNCVFVPMQMDEDELTLITGSELTFTVKVALPLHPFPSVT